MNLSSLDFYLATVVVIFGVDVLAGWALNLQYGYAGIPNFSFIVFQAAGAYTAAILTLGPMTATSGQTYVAGARVPFVVALLAAMAGGAALSAVIGVFAMKRMRADYQAAILLILALILNQFITTDTSLFNGTSGLANISRPLGSLINPSTSGWQWAYAGLVWAVCAVVLFAVQRLSRSSWGRALRAQRDHDAAAAALGCNVVALKMQVFVVGGAIAGLSGGLLVFYLQAWNTASWGYEETLAIFVSILIGGVANNWGVILGTFLVQIVFVEVPNLLPQFGYIGLVDALEWIVIGLLWMIAIAFRPQGMIPERRVRAERLGAPPPMSAVLRPDRLPETSTGGGAQRGPLGTAGGPGALKR
jgi:branched-chain amino acid transport system permease protein